MDTVQQSVQVTPSPTKASNGNSSSDDSKDATKKSEVIEMRPYGSWGPIFKNRETFVEMHWA
ncbi:hypothetical protein ACJMK2_006601 [Sinanodonta woodiana]|uniref:Uncharacterized protein n=1 Tax=Sinanodonta woodiana TaxID=1069815 RepID=A0ABD3VUD8_SINWO